MCVCVCVCVCVCSYDVCVCVCVCSYDVCVCVCSYASPLFFSLIQWCSVLLLNCSAPFRPPLHWICMIVCEFFTTSMRPTQSPMDRQPYGSILHTHRVSQLRLVEVCERWAVIGGCVRAVGCDWRMCESRGLRLADV